MSVFKTVLKLKAFLTPLNLQLLDILLGILTDPESPAYEPTWDWFKQKFPPEYQGVTEDAKQKLFELRAVIQEYRKAKKQEHEPEIPTPA